MKHFIKYKIRNFIKYKIKNFINHETKKGLKTGDTMTKKENLIAMLRGEPYQEVPVEFNLCPELVETYHEKTGSDQNYMEYFQMPWRNVTDIAIDANPKQFLKYYPYGLKEGTHIDLWGIAHEPGSAAAKHMTRMRYPLDLAEDLEELKAFPFPDFSTGDASHQPKQVKAIHEEGLAAVGNMQTTIWETSWYIRGMENLMSDMICEPEMAAFIFDKVTEEAQIRARSFALAGVDIIYLGDDIGMQHTLMMSEELYCEWILPRLKRVIQTIRSVNPDILIFYHSCGYVTPFIPYLIEAGIDVLNPIQSECMDFQEIFRKYGGKIGFHGTIGTQTTMPFASPREVKETIKRLLDIAGNSGRLFLAPTHLLEPEVPWENILAYVEACRDYPLEF